MFSASFATGVLAVVAPALTVGRGVPQVARLVSARSAGVSLSTWQLWLVVNELWIAYGVLEHVPAEVETNVATSLLAISVVALVGRDRSALGRSLAISLLATVLVAGFVFVAAGLGHGEIVSVVAVGGSLVLYLPQAVRVFRCGALDGVSPLTWWLAMWTALSWGLYGLLLDKPAISLPAVVMVPVAALIAVRVRPRPDRRGPGVLA